ncbi:MAG: hypothetical protein FWD75_03295 [Propionibacteriaceae bacterium]|nr:hypothetical protein [Propionibacteriaceae bacterium]
MTTLTRTDKLNTTHTKHVALEGRNVNAATLRSVRNGILGISQGMLAGWLGIASTSIASWESGLRPFPDKRAKQVESLVDTSESFSGSLVMDGLSSSDSPFEIVTYATDEALWSAIPEFDGVPCGVHLAAVARAWSRLRSNGVDVVIVAAE